MPVRRIRSRVSPRLHALRRKFTRIRNPNGAPPVRGVPKVPRRPAEQPRSLLESQRAFPDEAACADYMERVRCVLGSGGPHYGVAAYLIASPHAPPCFGAAPVKRILP